LADALVRLARPVEKKQLEEACSFGAMLGQALIKGKDLAALNFQTPLAIISGGN
jgi:hypothetical protein